MSSTTELLVLFLTVRWPCARMRMRDAKFWLKVDEK